MRHVRRCIIAVKAQSIVPFILSVHCLVTQCIVYNEACKKVYYSGESTFHFVGALFPRRIGEFLGLERNQAMGISVLGISLILRFLCPSQHIKRKHQHNVSTIIWTQYNISTNICHVTQHTYDKMRGYRWVYIVGQDKGDHLVNNTIADCHAFQIDRNEVYGSRGRCEQKVGIINV